MRTLSLPLCLVVVFALTGCGKKEPPPPPQPQVEKPAPKPEPAAPAVVEDTTEKEAAPEPAPEPEPEAKATYPPGTYTIQVAAWERREDAENLASFYESKGYEARVEEADLSSGKWFRVRIGSYDSYQAAREVADTIQEKYKSDIWLVKL